MKTPPFGGVTRSSLLQSAISTRYAAGLITGASIMSLQAVTWTGTTSSDWNTGTNWSSGLVPNGVLAEITTTTPNIATVTTPIAAKPNVIQIGAAGQTGQLNIPSGSLSNAAGQSMFVGIGGAGAVGILNIADTASTGGPATGMGQGSGSLTVAVQGADAAGDFVVGENGAQGTVNINTSGTVAVTNDIFVGRGANSVGVMNLDNGIVSAGAANNGVWTAFGREGGQGTLNMSGGSYTSFGTFFVGRDANSVGAANISGGTITMGQGNFIVGENCQGDVDQTGGTINVGGQEFWVGNGAAGVATHTFDAGAINVGNWIAVGREGAEGTLFMHGGTLTKTGGGDVTIGTGTDGVGVVEQTSGLMDLQTGRFILGENGTGNGTFTISGGTLDVATNDIEVGLGAGAIGNLNLAGGTVSTNAIDGGAGLANVTFDGTNIIANGDRTDFFSDIDNGEILPGGMVVDSSGFALGGTNLFIAGAGGLTKNGAGSLNLGSVTNLLEYEGPTVVNAGSLTIPADQPGFSDSPGDITVADGATLGVAAQILGDQLVPTNVTFGSSGGTTLVADIGALELIDTLPTNALIDVAGDLTLNGDVTLNVTGENLKVGKLLLVRYDPANRSGSGNFVLGSAPDGVAGGLTVEPNFQGSGLTMVYLDISSVSQPRWNGTDATAVTTTGTITLDSTNLSVDSNAGIVVGQRIVAEGIPQGTTVTAIVDANNITMSAAATGDASFVDLAFVGAGTNDGVWDTVTNNWIEQSTDNPTTYADPSPVLFDDQALGSTDVNLVETVAPSQVVFDNSVLAYTLTGNGEITGSVGLLKKGSESLSITGMTNTYTGVTRLEGGTTTVDVLTNGGVDSPIGSASTLQLAGGVLEYTGPATTVDRAIQLRGIGGGVKISNDVTLTGAFTSAGDSNFTKTGAGTLSIPTTSGNAYGSGAIPGGDGAFVVDEGTLVLSGSGTHTATGEIQIGTLPNIPAHLILNNTTLVGNSWLGISRGNGDANVTSTLTATNSTIQSVNSSMGFNGGVANNSMSEILLTNTNWTNTNVIQWGESENAKGQITIEGSSTLTCNRFLLGLGADSNITVDVKDSGSINKTGGSWVSIGNSSNGEGTVNVSGNGSFISAAGDFNISDVDSSKGTLNLSDSGVVTSGGTIFVGKGNTTTGVINQSGGTLTAQGWLVIGRFGADSDGQVNVTGGVLNQTGASQAVNVGEEGQGSLNVSGSGVVTTAGNIRVATTASAQGTVNLGTGGSITAPAVVEPAGGGTSAVNFDGGILHASASNAAYLSVDFVTLNAGGGTIDTGANSIGVPSVMVGSGGLTKVGSGTLTLSGANIYEGTTTVSQGTLTTTNATVINDGSAVVVAAGATLNLDFSGVEVVSALTINGVALPNGVYTAADSAQITGTGSIAVGAAPADPFADWIGDYFPGETDVAVVGPDADPDGDGQSNLVEFALGGVPNDGGDNAKVYVLKADSDADGDTTAELLMTVAVRAGATFSGSPSPTATQDGVLYEAVGSVDLASFDEIVNSVTPVTTGLPGAPTGYEYRTFSLNGSNGFPSVGFLRMNVTKP